MTNDVHQKKAFSLAGGLTMVNVQNLIKPNTASSSLLSIVMVQDLVKLSPHLTKPHVHQPNIWQMLPTLTAVSNLSKPDMSVRKPATYMWDYSLRKSGEAYRSPQFYGDCHSAKVSAQNLTKPDIEKCVTGCMEGFSVVTTRAGEFSDSIKKGSTASATSFINQPNIKPRCNYSFGFLRCSLLSLRPQASSTQAEKFASGDFSFSRSTLAPISSIKSCGKRIPLYTDFPFLCPVPMCLAYAKWFNNMDNTSCINFSEVFKHKLFDVFKQCGLICLNTLSMVKVFLVPKIAKPSSGGTLAGLLTKTLIEVTIMADIQSTQTRPKYQYRFLALDRANRKATPCRLSVEASTEHEARQILCAHFILSLAARLPALEATHG